MSTLKQKVLSGELTPIIFLPMETAETCHINLGTGGNFVQNGTLDTASRGANQDNCKASYFDGTSDYLSRTTSIGAVSSKLFTLSCFVASTDNMTAYRVFQAKATYDSIIVLSPYLNSGLTIYLYNSTPALILNVSIPFTSIPSKRNVKVDISFDLSDITKRHAFLDGKEVSAIWNTYTNDNYAIGASTTFYIGCDNGTSLFLPGNIGELYFDTKYIDLATNNPFWDKDTNRPKPVRQVIRETGVTPLIAVPLDASNAGKNYGTGGDFTANSAPYVGARGGSEFWARSAKFDGSTGYLSRTSPFSTNGKKITVVMAIRTDVAIAERIFTGSSPSSLNVINIGKANTNELYVRFQNGTTNVYSVVQTATTDLVFNTIMVSFDLSDINKRHFIVNRNEVNPNYATYTNLDISFGDLTSIAIGAITDGTQKWNGFGSLMYVLQDYIDFSQEVNRNKFVDQLGYPKDLKAQISAGVIPKPIFYLPFDDPTNLGKDASGNNNHFTVNGTVTQGADVNG